MKNFLSLFVAGIAMLLLSCNDSGKTSEESTTEPVDQSAATQVVAPESTPPVETIADTQATTTSAQSKGDGSVALNPAHGQPGHRCEIAVGAPLSSAPAKVQPGGKVLPTAEQGSTTQPVQIQTEPATTEPAPEEPKSIMTAPASTSPKDVSSTAPGMNPPHGQPGHDCAVAVGAPLKSK